MTGILRKIAIGVAIVIAIPALIVIFFGQSAADRPRGRGR